MGTTNPLSIKEMALNYESELSQTKRKTLGTILPREIAELQMSTKPEVEIRKACSPPLTGENCESDQFINTRRHAGGT